MGLVSYQQSEFLSDNTVEWMNNYIVGLSIISSSQHRVALATGLYYSWRRSSGTATHVVPAGFSNSGEVLSLEQRTAANTLQVPLLLHYSFLQTKSVAFIAAGAVPGYSISNSTSQTVLVSTYDLHAFVPRQSAQPVAAQDAGIERGALFGFQAGGGTRPRFGAHALVLEAYVEKGYQINGNSVGGRLTYQGTLLRVGFDF